MRILQVTHYMLPHMGGIERYASMIIEGLARRGHDLHWIASATPERPGRHQGHIRVGTWNVVEARTGLPYPLWSPNALAILMREVRRADVVHAHDCLYMGSAAAAGFCREAGKPFVLTQHVGWNDYGPLLNAVQHAAYATLGRLVLAAAARRIVVSRHVAQWFRSIGFPKPFQQISTGIDDALFRVPTDHERRTWRGRHGIPADDRIAIFVGRLVRRKGISRLINAYRELRRAGVALLVIGDGPLRAELPADPGLIHRAWVPPEDMRELYGLADVFLLPSHGEGFPISLQEAMMSGLPAVVSTDPAYVTNLAGAPGVILPGLSAELAAPILSLLASAPPRATVAEWARARWSRAAFLDAYERVFEELS